MDTIPRRYSNPNLYDISIDSDDSPDGSDGGYDKHANFVIPSAMQELVSLRIKTTSLRTALTRLIADYESIIRSEYEGTSMEDDLLSNIDYARKALSTENDVA